MKLNTVTGSPRIQTIKSETNEPKSNNKNTQAAYPIPLKTSNASERTEETLHVN